VALPTVFVLNSVALFAFPWIGRHLGLGDDAFGTWAALAIHDTSSVIGAASQFGARALEVATAAKLARALWIVPVTLGIATWRRRAVKNGGGRTPAARRPWFIAGFVAAAAIVTFVPALRPAGHLVAMGARRLLCGTLFLVGLGLSREALRLVGARPLVQGVALWLALASASLAAILAGWIR
jgi:uncharacterized membrane protein YadS